MNIDFAKVLLDESHTPFIPLDLHGDAAWEKLLSDKVLALAENNADGNEDKEEFINSGMEMRWRLKGLITKTADAN
ncbi:hypothetical protein V6N13_012748 [Hibiscus sabdariffa]|uniref:Uncharacterized protein n=1 Tax=Hibiscus sabdariffa TaxID=183260 RepID=A0ABR2SG53_9ROSI